MAEEEQKESTEYHHQPDHDGQDPVGHVNHVPLLRGGVLILLYLDNLFISDNFSTAILKRKFT